MTHPLRDALPYVLAMLAAVSTGCAAPNPTAPATTPFDQYGAVKSLYVTTLRVLALARAGGAIDDATWERILQLKASAQFVFDAVEADLAAGKTPDLDTALAAINGYLDGLLAGSERSRDHPTRASPAELEAERQRIEAKMETVKPRGNV